MKTLTLDELNALEEVAFRNRDSDQYSSLVEYDFVFTAHVILRLLNMCKKVTGLVEALRLLALDVRAYQNTEIELGMTDHGFDESLRNACVVLHAYRSEQE